MRLCFSLSLSHLHTHTQARGLENSSMLVNAILQGIVVLCVALLVFIFVSGCPDLEWGKEWFNTTFT